MKKSELLKQLACDHNPKKPVIVFDKLHISLCQSCIIKYEDLGVKVEYDE